MSAPPALTVINLGGASSHWSWRSCQAGTPPTACRTASAKTTHAGSRPASTTASKGSRRGCASPPPRCAQRAKPLRGREGPRQPLGLPQLRGHSRPPKGVRRTGRRRRQAERPPEGRGTDRGAPQHSGPRGAGHDAEPLPEPARQGDRGQPRMHGNAGQRQAHALQSHPPPDAEGPWGGRLRRPFQIGGWTWTTLTTRPASTGASTTPAGKKRRGRRLPSQGVPPEDFAELLERLKEAGGPSRTPATRGQRAGDQSEAIERYEG